MWLLDISVKIFEPNCLNMATFLGVPGFLFPRKKELKKKMTNYDNILSVFR